MLTNPLKPTSQMKQSLTDQKQFRNRETNQHLKYQRHYVALVRVSAGSLERHQLHLASPFA